MASSSNEHPEWEHVNSLSAPADFDKEALKYRPSQGVTLNDAEVSAAMESLVVRDFVAKFPKVDKFYADPTIPGQQIALHSFVPAKGATPDKDGIYGMVKVRGVFATQREADERAEYLIRNADSYHSIYHSYVGRPFPLSRDKKYVANTVEIDIRKKTTETIDKDVKDKRDDERKQMEEIKDREKKLRDDVSSDIDPEDRYTELQVKRAQLSWTYVETLKKLDEYKRIILKAREDIAALEEKNPEVREKYVEKYMAARREAGLKENEESFLAYLTKDPEGLGF